MITATDDPHRVATRSTQLRDARSAPPSLATFALAVCALSCTPRALVRLADPPDASAPRSADGLADSPRAAIDLDPSWRFLRSDVASGEAPALDDSTWSTVSLPHTWNAIDGQQGGPYYRGPAWYRRHIALDAALAGKRIFVRFEAANLVADVYLNGHHAGQHQGGYSAFCFDVTDLAHASGDNVLAVRVDNSMNADVIPLVGDMTYFGGLYRNVRLYATDGVHVDMLDYASSGLYVTPTNVTARSASLGVRARVRNDTASTRTITATASLIDATQSVVAVMHAEQTVSASSTAAVAFTTTVNTPHRWNGREDPYLYALRFTVSDASGAVVDSVTQPVGFRSFTVDANTGFTLNDVHLDVHGVNRHEDRRDMGFAVTDREHDEDFAIIADMGANAIRLGGYQGAEHFFQLTDAGGMVTWAEIPLIDHITSSDAFTQNTHQQLLELIRQNYNHPSIFFWSIANEPTLMSGPDVNLLLADLAALCHREDPTRLSAMAAANTTNGEYLHTDVAGFNRYDGWYGGSIDQFGPNLDALHARIPTLAIGVTEYGAGASPFFHSDTPRALDHTEEFQNFFHESYWNQRVQRPYLWGSFVWVMFDVASSGRHEGDTPGINDKGVVTFDRRIRKDAYYFYRANWSRDPFVYVTARRWTMRTNASTYVKAYSNLDQLEAWLDDISLGLQRPHNGVFTWPGVTLHSGVNHVRVAGVRAGTQYTDSVAWSL